MLKITSVVAILSLLLLHQECIEAADARRRWGRRLQKKSKSGAGTTPTTTLPDNFTTKKKPGIPKHCLYVEEEVLWTELFTDVSYLDLIHDGTLESYVLFLTLYFLLHYFQHFLPYRHIMKMIGGIHAVIIS